MQTIYLDTQRPGILPKLHAKQNDSLSRFFKVVLLDGPTAYTIPEGAEIAVRFSAPASSGWYDTITLPDETTRSAFSVSGNEVTCELASEACAAPGTVKLCLDIYTAAGYKLGSWDLCLQVEADPVSDSAVEVSEYYSVLTGQVATALAARDAAAASAAAAAASAAQTASAVTSALSVYDSNGDGVVDDAEDAQKLNGHDWTYYGTAATEQTLANGIATAQQNASAAVGTANAAQAAVGSLLLRTALYSTEPVLINANSHTDVTLPTLAATGYSIVAVSPYCATNTDVSVSFKGLIDDVVNVKVHNHSTSDKNLVIRALVLLAKISTT